ncbi:Uncharacterised protein [Streptococcus dysgalactiae subsp. equisimilis]|nr:Uncharacterised protein [Streptococcus dysgalactiae subsp. equisimilis]
MCSSRRPGTACRSASCHAWAVLQETAATRTPMRASWSRPWRMPSSGCAAWSSCSAVVRSTIGNCPSQCAGKAWSLTGRRASRRHCSQAWTNSRAKSTPAAGPMPPRMPTIAGCSNDAPDPSGPPSGRMSRRSAPMAVSAACWTWRTGS